MTPRRMRRVPRMQREYGITPSQTAVSGALGIYVDGRHLEDPSRMLFALSVLRSATEAQVHAAMPFVAAGQNLTTLTVAAMFDPEPLPAAADAVASG